MMGFASKIAASQAASGQSARPTTTTAPGSAPSYQAYSPAPPGQQYPPAPPGPSSSPYPTGPPGPSGSPYPAGPPGASGSPYPGGPAGGPVGGPVGGPPPGAGYGPPGGGPPQAAVTPQQVNAYRQLLIDTIQEKNLQNFYPPQRLDHVVQGLANAAPGKLQRLTHEWSVPMEVATDVMKLSLFDVILYVDDSGSIEFEEKGVRKDQLRQIIGIVATAASTFDEDGISVRFMNSTEMGDGIRNAEDVDMLVSRVRFQGLTPLGTNLRNKVLDPMVVGPARTGRLNKPVLVITITDGQPAGEPHDAVADGIRYAVEEVSRSRYGRGAVSFQFTQVGNDTRARDFLSALDEDPQIGNLIDCTSNFEVEQDEMSRANPPVYLTRELWCAKLMLGAIDASYDTKDEKAAGGPPGASGPPMGRPPTGPPSGPPTGPPTGARPGSGGPYPPYSQGPGYGGQPGYYSPSPGGQYGPGPGAGPSPGPSPGGYGQAPYPGGPPVSQPGYAPSPYGYGAPSPHPGYGAPQSGYGAPPPQAGYGRPPQGYPPGPQYGQGPPPPPRY